MSRFNPLDYPVCIRFPVWLTHSAWMEHVPFAMFLIDALRPRVFVELGTHFGVSYCAFCQAVKETGAQTRCYAVDTWRGDPQAGFFGDEVLGPLRKHHDPLYGSFSRLLQATFEEAAEHFGAGSIDLLHIDGFHTYEAVRADYEGWLPKMSERGVMLFHDINVREGDFGVWRLWDELKARYPHFEMMHGHGLGLIAVGPEQPEQLRMLTEAAEDELQRIREFFYQLGARLEFAQELQTVTRHSRELAAAQAAQVERLREQHPLLFKTSNFFQACAHYGLGGGLRLGFSKVRRRLSPDAPSNGGQGGGGDRNASPGLDSSPAPTRSAES